MSGYVHGYGTPEQARLVQQAEHWRYRLIRDGTELAPGAQLLEVGCGVGAVLAVLGQEFPGVVLSGVDIEPAQLAFGRVHLARSGVAADLVEADATALPFKPASFDHVWMMWFLEHLADPTAALREAKRVLRPGGRLTAIEVDYATCRADRTTPAIDALFEAMVGAMAAAGWSDAGSRLPGWLETCGFCQIEPGRRAFWWQGEELAQQAAYAADVMESAIEALIEQGASEQTIRQGLADLRALPDQQAAGLGWEVHKSIASTSPEERWSRRTIRLRESSWRAPRSLPPDPRGGL